MRIKKTFQIVGETEMSKWEMIDKLFEDCRIEFPGEYINSEGFWENWDSCGGHGSGLTTVGRRATDAEVKIWEAFVTLREYCINRK